MSYAVVTFASVPNPNESDFARVRVLSTHRERDAALKKAAEVANQLFAAELKAEAMSGGSGEGISLSTLRIPDDATWVQPPAYCVLTDDRRLLVEVHLLGDAREEASS